MDDVVVVGAGPAGSATAFYLARAGLRVTIVERTPFPRRKVCGEYLGAGAVGELDRLGVAARVRRTASRLRGVRLIPAGAAPTVPIELDFDAEALSVPRERLDALLLENACGAGAAAVNARAEDLLYDRKRACGVTLRDAAGERVEIRARYIVGADGIGSMVARKSGLTMAAGGARRFAVGGHYTGFGDLDACVEMYVGSGTYFALNPLDPVRTNVMLVVPQTQLGRWADDVDEGVRGKAAELARGQRRFDAAQRIGERASVGPLAHRTRSPVAPGVVLAGDAAGFLNPFTGQGVYLALSTGRSAAAAILDALAAPMREERVMCEYARSRVRDFAVRRTLSRFVTAVVDVPWLAASVSARLRRNRALGTTLLSALGGLEPPSTVLCPAFLGRLLVA